MTKLKIDGMSCEHCVRAVSGALQEVPGVETVVEVSLERGEATVEGSAETAALIAAVEEEGYRAEAVE
ncbi:MAG: cation transporter [Thermoanaerobaculia bacterium]|jgi:copper chaperone